jgi:hypothetical protein
VLEIEADPAERQHDALTDDSGADPDAVQSRAEIARSD